MNLYVLVLAVIVLVLMGVSLSQLRKVKTKADYLVAGRSLPAYVLVFTLLSSWIGAGSLFAGAENAFRNGFAALWQPAGGWLALLIIYFVAPRARKFAQFTIPDLLETRYNTTARVLGTIAILFAYTAITSYQFRAGGDILHLVFPEVSKEAGTIVIAAFVIAFTAVAGMASVAYMDLAIGLLISVIGLVAAPVLLARAGGWSGLHAALPESHFTLFGEFGVRNGINQGAGAGLTRALEYFLPTFLLMLGNQSMYQKFFSAKTERDARVAVAGWFVGTGILETLIVAIAVFGSAMYFTVPSSELNAREIIPYTARNALPQLLGAILMGAVFAKVISTANNYLFSPATNLINDVYTRFINRDASHRNVLVVSRVLVVLLGAWALYQGLRLESILAKAMYAYTIYSAAITPVVMATFFWNRVTAAAAVTSIALGTAVTVFWNEGARLLPPALAERDAIFPALVVSVVALVVVSMVTPAPRREQLAPFA
ncbi:MAG TPA: sodium:solute symporter family protein [Vicinamibacterales bacterium]|nr:sodium:solute symporter family protein [Vicinamibacterales bacterium]